jgi:tetratricopeptide (TPR) repeat protein
MTQREQEALHLCDLGLQAMWRGEVDPAIELYDRAAGAAESEETREMITIRKAEALIAADREGAEIAKLPAIVMRRRTPRHVYLAAYALMRHHSETQDRKRALSYGKTASSAAAELGEPMACANVLNGIGIIHVVDSEFRKAIETFERALAFIEDTHDHDARLLEVRNGVIANLGGARILSGDIDAGIVLLETVLPRLGDDYAVVEALLDLCFAYLEREEYVAAEEFGRRALEMASVQRQVRNANHLLGEVCVRQDRHDEADHFFDVVASYYPDFKNVKQLLVAVDLCSVVNWKA